MSVEYINRYRLHLQFSGGGEKYVACLPAIHNRIDIERKVLIVNFSFNSLTGLRAFFLFLMFLQTIFDKVKPISNLFHGEITFFFLTATYLSVSVCATVGDISMPFFHHTLLYRDSSIIEKWMKTCVRWQREFFIRPHGDVIRVFVTITIPAT